MMAFLRASTCAAWRALFALSSAALLELVHGLLLDRGEVPPLVIQLRLHLSRSARHELLLLLLRLLLQRIVGSLKLVLMLLLLLLLLL